MKLRENRKWWVLVALALSVLIIATIWLGIYPRSILDALKNL